MKRFLRCNGLSIVLVIITLASVFGQIITGWQDYNNDRTELGAEALSLGEYLTSGHFIEAIFENWESEFLQMGLYVVLTVFLYQKGSSESKDPDSDDEEVDREPNPKRPGAPGPVKKGGLALKLYQNSLSLAFFGLFIVSFLLHAYGAAKEHNAEEAMMGRSDFQDMWQIIGGSEFWFQSFQNWQSEFLSVLSIVVLSIWLRQKGSPESKPVDAAHNDTGE